MLAHTARGRSYVPCYISHAPVIGFRGVLVCDGAMTSVMPVQPGATHVCAFPRAIIPFGRCPPHDIGPDMQVQTAPSLGEKPLKSTQAAHMTLWY